MAKKTAKQTAKKTPKKKAAKSAGGKGKRYSEAAKQKVIAFVREVNEARGRGGVAAAARKFRVSPLSINNWLRKHGAGSGNHSGRRGSSGAGRDRVLGEMTSLNREINRRRSELEALEARFEKLKASL